MSKSRVARPVYSALVSSERLFQLVVFAREEVEAFNLPRAGEVTIGRDEANAVCIDDPSVSRQHALLRVGETLEIEDLGGANGTFVRQRAPRAALPVEGAGLDVHISLRHLVGVPSANLGGRLPPVRHRVRGRAAPPRVVIPLLGSTGAAGGGPHPGRWCTRPR